MNNQEKVLEIIQEELKLVLENVQSHYEKNFKTKQENFLYRKIDTEIVAYMSFVSSFESVLGNKMENIAREIIMLNFGKDNLKKIINPNNLNLNNISDKKYQRLLKGKGQYIITNLNIDNDKFIGEISEFRKKYAKGNGNTESQLDKTKFNELLKISKKYVSNSNVYVKPVDIAFKNTSNKYVLMELKCGGGLDTSNAPANIDKMLITYCALQDLNAEMYFSTIYGNPLNWKANPKKYLRYPDMFLIGENFWNYILPPDISFETFNYLYEIAITNIKFNEKIRKIIKNWL